MTRSILPHRASLATSIIWRFVLYATLPVVVVGGCALIVLIRQNLHDVRDGNLERARSIALQVDGCVREPRAVLQALAVLLSDTLLVPPEKVDSLLASQCSASSMFEAIRLVDTSVHSGAAGSVRPGEGIVDTSGSLSQPNFRLKVDSLAVASVRGGLLQVVVPVGSSRRALVGTCSAGFFSSRFGADIVERGEIVAVVNRYGQSVYGSDYGSQIREAVTAVFLQRERTGAGSRDTTFSLRIDGRKFVGAVAPVGSAELAVFVARKTLAAYAPALDAVFFFVMVLAVFGLLSAGGGWFVARWLSRIFTYLSHNTRRIAQGDYQAQMPMQRYQELESLADNIRSMVAAVREREEQYRELNHETRRHLRFQRTLLEAINIPVVYYNVQGDILGCNSMFESAMGVSRDLLLHYHEVRDAPAALWRLMGLIRNGADGAYAFEKTVVFGDGRTHTVIIHQAPYYLEEGGVDGYICAILDITEHRLVEDAFQRLIQNTVGIHGVDFFHRIVRLLCEWIGCDGALIGELTSPGECRALSMMFNGLRVDEYIFSLEFSPARKAVSDGFVSIEDDVCTLFPFDRELKRLAIRGYAAVPLTAHDGTPLGVLELYSRAQLRLPSMARGSMEILAAMAASELLRMRAERERVKLESQLRQMEKMNAIGQLAGGIAHDINNQLGCILGYADIIQDATTVPETSNFIGKISQSVSRAADLVKKLLAFSRHGNFVMKPVNVTALVHEVVGLLQHSIDKSIALSMVAADGQLYVMGDPTQLQNALLNLGLNARDAMPDGGTITYEVNAMELDEENVDDYPGCSIGAYVRIRVCDTGVGIVPEIIDRIFEPFFTTKAEGKGTGLGLAAVYGTVSSHRGTINVQSDPGEGAVFTVMLPSHAAPAEANGIVEAKTSVFQAGLVLVIDDEIDIRETTALMLRKCGCTVITAGDGLEGVQLYIKYSGKIDLVILDMVLPGIDGKGTFDRLLEIDPLVRVVIVSGYSVDGRVQAVLDRGARSFLQKPFRAVDLIKLVAEVLGEKAR